MAQDARWQLLPLKSHGGMPQLLVSTSFTPSSYAVHVTDLTRIWSESLDRKAIIMRAFSDSTSIDPSDGDNMASFIKCLEAALDPAQPNHGLTTLSLSRANHQPYPPAGSKTSPSPTTAASPPLMLTATCKLPAELSSTPLTWTMHLTPGDAPALAAELVLPLVAAQHAHRRREKALADVVRQKDAVLKKVLDKLEASGLPLASIFRSLPPKRPVSREQAGALVDGLAPFDEEAWAASNTAREEREAPELAVMVRDVFFGSGVPYSSVVGRDGSSQVLLAADGQWWDELGTPGMVTGGAGTDGKGCDSPTNQAAEGASSAEAAADAHCHNGEAQDDEEADDDDDDGLDGPVASMPRRPAPARARVGMIGGRAKASSRNVVPAKRAVVADAGSATASEDEEGEDDRPSPPRPDAASPSSALGDGASPMPSSSDGTKPIGRGRLGVIGGRGRGQTRRPTPGGSPTPPPRPTAEEDSSSGGKAAKSTPEATTIPPDSKPGGGGRLTRGGIGKIGGRGGGGGLGRKGQQRQQQAQVPETMHDDDATGDEDDEEKSGQTTSRADAPAQHPVERKPVVRPVKKKRKF